MAYTRVNWENLPSTNTPVNATNLNIMDKGIKDLDEAINNDGIAHNGIYRGKDITTLFYNGTLSQQITAGTFDDIYIGDYIIGQTSNTKYLVADINYRLKAGTLTNHVLMIPATIIGSAKMNSTATSTGAYVNSQMYTTNLTNAKNTIKGDFGTSHIVTYSGYFAKGVASGGYENSGGWYDSDIDLMNEIMVFGSNINHNILHGTAMPLNITTDTRQLAIFQLNKSRITASDTNANGSYYWLRDVASTTEFCMVGYNGFVNHDGAAQELGIRPAFLIK